MIQSNSLRPWLVMGRVSNVPTVWSNCLAAWLLGGCGRSWGRFCLLCAGATLLYVAGMYLNDAFDATYDAQHRRERPIPAGIVSLTDVWRAGLVLIAGGLLLIAPLGVLALLNAVLLAGCIVVYDAVHKLVTVSPVLMAFCRFFLYLTACAAASGTVTGVAMWSGLALALYVTGLSCLARRESTRLAVQTWPLVLLAAPIGLALLVSDGAARQRALLVTVIVVLWVARSLRPAFSPPRNVGRAVSGLLAGIVWVDLLAVANQPREVGAAFVALFLLALFLQRFVPAT